MCTCIVTQNPSLAFTEGHTKCLRELGYTGYYDIKAYEKRDFQFLKTLINSGYELSIIQTIITNDDFEVFQQICNISKWHMNEADVRILIREDNVKYLECLNKCKNLSYVEHEDEDIDSCGCCTIHGVCIKEDSVQCSMFGIFIKTYEIKTKI